MLIITKYNTYKNSDFLVFNTATMKQKLVKTRDELKDIYIKNSGECYNFLFDKRGFRYLTNEDIKTGIRYNLTLKDLEEDIKLLDTKGIKKELKDLKEILPDNKTALVETSNAQKKILLAEKANNKEIVDATNLLVSKLDEVLNKIDETSSQTNDTLSVLDKKLNEFGITFEEYLKKYDELFVSLQAEMQKEYLYPSCGVDIYSDRHELSDFSKVTMSDLNSDIELPFSSNPIKSINTLGQITFNDGVSQADKILVQELYKHLTVVNKNRLQIEKVIDRDMHSDNAKIRLQDIKYTLVVTGILLGGMASGGLLGVIGQGAMGKLIADASGVTFVGLSVKQLQGLRLGTKEQLSREKVATVKILSIDDMVAFENDQKTLDAYTNQLRKFMLMALSCNYTTNDYKEIFNKLKVKVTNLTNKDNEYLKYIDTTVFDIKEIPIDDFSLFRFYVKGYLEFKTARRNLDVTSYVNKFYYTQSGIDTLKCFMNKFINAYFAAKMFTFDNLKDENKWNENLRLMPLKFLRYFAQILKICLIMQGMSISTANELIKGYMKVNNISYVNGAFEYDYSGER